MKKSLFLLPFAAFMLAGCGEDPQPVPPPVQHTHSWSATYQHDETNHWKTCSGCSEKGELAAHTFNGDTCSVCGYKKDSPTPPGPSGDIILDFTDTVWKDEKITPYIDAEKDMGVLKTFTYDDIEYNDIGCYASAGYEGAPNYLMMKNTKYGSDKKQYSTSPAFFGNKTPFASPIKKITVVVEGTSSSDSCVYRVTAGSSAATQCVTSGGKTGSKGQTIVLDVSDSNALYFAVSTNKTSDNKVYNGQIVSVSINF